MNQDKMRRIVTACVSACTVLFVLLFAFLVYQWIYKAQLDKKEKKLLEEIAYYEQLIEEKSDNLEFFESELYKFYTYQELLALQGDK